MAYVLCRRLYNLDISRWVKDKKTFKNSLDVDKTLLNVCFHFGRNALKSPFVVYSGGNRFIPYTKEMSELVHIRSNGQES
jgi:hypothetical protein